jgi:SPP1 gp7 family putative phage head morphogenesis protein
MVDANLAKQVEEIIKGLGLSTVVYETVMQDISKYYYLGIENLEKMIQFNVGTVNPDVLSFLREYNFSLVRDMNEDLANKLRSSISRNLVSGDRKNMVKEIKDIFNTTENRAKAIARTETTRAYNVGSYTGAKQAKERGINVKKYWLAVLDNRTSPLCIRLSRKYNKEKPINLDDSFIDVESGWRGLTPPSHVGCRSDVVYVRA